MFTTFLLPKNMCEFKLHIFFGFRAVVRTWILCFFKQLEFFSQKIEDYKLRMCRQIDLSFYYNWPSFKDHRNPFYSLSLLANLLPHSVLNSPKNTSQIYFLFILNSSVSHSSLNCPPNRSQESSFNFSSRIPLFQPPV